ncbi:MAG: hypothetical protein HXY43_23685 [Fischerella sp.]|uniref:hypothetical protein n=1 Tax=Fischerella sp. TaxID=1191 RepID=UPI0017AB9B44|nr:hypothetical protein [Fischerella sp.]NWF62175.1 hypothetical protein [Fischerella sp.]
MKTPLHVTGSLRLFQLRLTLYLGKYLSAFHQFLRCSMADKPVKQNFYSVNKNKTVKLKYSLLLLEYLNSRPIAT